MNITEIKLNKGMDIKGTCYIDGELCDVYIATAVSVERAVQLLSQYANGPLEIEYQVLDGNFREKDIKKFNKRIDTLLNRCSNLEIVKPIENKVVQGYVWNNYFVTGLNYNKESK